jgi:hypothetical protein
LRSRRANAKSRRNYLRGRECHHAATRQHVDYILGRHRPRMRTIQ